MANTIVNNPNSLIQFEQISAQPEPSPCYSGCDDLLPRGAGDPPCLPIYSLRDLAFQITVEDPSETFFDDLAVGIYIGGDCPSSPVTDANFFESFNFDVIYLADGTGVATIDLGNETIAEDLCEAGTTEGQCIRIVLFDSSTDDVRACSNCFTYTSNICYTKRIRYTNLENAFGFYYEDDPLGAYVTFYNKARVFITLHSPMNPEQKTGFLDSTGNWMNLQSRFDEDYRVLVDYQVHQFHRSLQVAMGHDTFEIYDEDEDEYNGYFKPQDIEYERKWLEEPGKYLGVCQAELTLRVTPFFNQNSNC
jgi:hypothetical protein